MVALHAGAANLTVHVKPVRRTGVLPAAVNDSATRFALPSQMKVHDTPMLLHPAHMNLRLPWVLSIGDAIAIGPENANGNVPEVLDHVPVIVHEVPAVQMKLPTWMKAPEPADDKVFAPEGDTVSVDDADAWPTITTNKAPHTTPSLPNLRSFANTSLTPHDRSSPRCLGPAGTQDCEPA